MMYDELIGELHIVASGVQSKRRRELLEKAADAIEELSRRLDESIPKGDAEIIISEVAKPRWIPVTEQLPEHLTSVIIHRKDGGIFMWEYFNTSPTDECWIDDRMNVYSFCDVTHWMPLPEPPKEET